MYRQGDVLLVELSRLPEGVRALPREGGRVVLAYGEATGHAHVVEGDAELLADGGSAFEASGGPAGDAGGLSGRRFLRVEREAFLVHEEHAAVVVAPGAYEVRRQREYSPQAPRFVCD